MSRRRGGIMSAWMHQERSAHAEALGSPQPFPLTGDGDCTARVNAACRLQRDLAGALADARYRDWLAQREAPQI